MEKENLKNDMEMFRNYSGSFYALPKKILNSLQMCYIIKYNKGEVVLQEDKVYLHHFVTDKVSLQLLFEAIA